MNLLPCTYLFEMIITRFLVIISFSIYYTFSIQRCKQYQRYLRYYKIRNCYKSGLPVIAWTSVNSVNDCMIFARERKGLAFNFSPPEAANLTKGFIRNCQILGCPEIQNSTTLNPDPIFDYYTAYANFNTTENATCLTSVGLFNLIHIKNNYTEAITHCQNLGADLAEVVIESASQSLANLLQSIDGWYKAAYIGLDDIITEGNFQTPLGYYLSCTKFRAWSPGHPRKTKNEDCVILDEYKVWRAIHCNIKLPFICEYYPEAPFEQIDIKYIPDCFKIKSKGKKDKCITNNQWFEIYNSSSRLDQCALALANTEEKEQEKKETTSL